MLTQHKNLRSGKPVWTAYPQRPLPVTTLSRDLETDVVIIGAGISAAFMAEELSSRGFKIIMLDRRPPLKGSTFATTALLQHEMDVPLSHLSKMIGFDKAVAAWRRSKLSLQSLTDKTRYLDIDCRFQGQESLYLSGTILDKDGLKTERDIRARAGLQSDFIGSAELERRFGIYKRSALHSFGNYLANPHQLAHGYLMKAVEKGARIFSSAEVDDIDAGTRKVHLHIKSGYVVTAKHVVFCTGYEVPKQLKSQNFEISSTWALATGPRQVPQDFPMIWEASDPYLYLRATPDGRMICGGEDEGFADEEKRKALTSTKIATLEKKIGKLLSIEAKAEYAWSGSFGVTPTGMPLIGPVPRLKNCYAVLAFGGNGIVGSRIGAEIVSGYLTDKPDPDAGLYNFN